MDAIRAAGGEVLALAAIVDRTEPDTDFGVPFYPLTRIAFPTYAEDELPAELAAMPVTKPGSRK
jgi:orotate phosphoribosyltransferase